MDEEAHVSYASPSIKRFVSRMASARSVGFIQQLLSFLSSFIAHTVLVLMIYEIDNI